MYHPICPICARSKMQRPHSDRTNRKGSTRTGDLIFTDIHGPVAIESSQGFRYMIHFTDDFSRYTKVYFLKSRAGSAVTEKFKDYCNWLKKVHHQQHKDDFRVREVVPVRSIQVDGAQEYVAGEFAQHCEDMNIMQRVTSPYLHENAAIAERVWKTLQEVAMPMLTLGDLDRKFWPAAFRHANWICNRK